MRERRERRRREVCQRYGNQPSCVRICMDICLLSMEIYLDLYGVLYETLCEMYKK